MFSLSLSYAILLGRSSAPLYAKCGKAEGRIGVWSMHNFLCGLPRRQCLLDIGVGGRRRF